LATHRITFRVYYEDTDAGGIVYHARYLAFAERARTEAIRSVDAAVTDLAREYEQHFVVRKADIRYMSPLRLDDLMEIETALVDLTPTRIKLSQSFRNVSRNNESSAIVNVELACLGISTMKPERIPTSWCERVRKLEAGEV